MTPCEEKNYQIGDLFEYMDDDPSFEKGSILKLVWDDGTDIPLFALISGECEFRNCCAGYDDSPIKNHSDLLQRIATDGDADGGYAALNHVRKLEK